MITSARDETDGLGFMNESKAREGRFSMSADHRIADPDQERLLLIATIQDLIEHEIVLREVDEFDNSLLVFPSQTTRAYPGRMPEPDATTTIWTFEGAVLNIYSTLVVRLWHTGLFRQRETYENVVFYTNDSDEQCRLFLIDRGEGEAELRMFHNGDQNQGWRVYVEEYIHAHLERRAMPGTVRKRRVIACDHCGSIMKAEHIERRRQQYDWMNCPVCDQRIQIGRADEEVSARRSLLRQRMVVKLDETANRQRRRQTAISIVQGKEAIGDYDAYVSYHARDRAATLFLSEQLKEHAVLPWLDQPVPQDGSELPALIRERIYQMGSEGKVMLYVVGSHGPGQFQQRELMYAVTYHLRPILVLLPDAGRKPRVPIELQYAERIDFRNQDEQTVKALVNAILHDRPSFE